MLRLSSAVRTFAEERCALDPEAKVTKDDLYSAWQQWCRANGDRPPGGREAFGAKLLTAYAGKVKPTRLNVAGERPWGYAGIRLIERAGSKSSVFEQDDIPF